MVFLQLTHDLHLKSVYQSILLVFPGYLSFTLTIDCLEFLLNLFSLPHAFTCGK